MKAGVIKKQLPPPTVRTELDFETGEHRQVEEDPSLSFPYRVYMHGKGPLYFESTSQFATEEDAKRAAKEFLEDALKTLSELKG